MDFRSIFSYIGVMLEILGILCLIPVIISWVYGDGAHLMFIIAGIISFAIGTVLDKNLEKKDLGLGSAMTVTALSFIIISIFGAIPFMSEMSVIDALFESVSGFTTTGLSVVVPEELPMSLLFWRSFTQWIGGVGILMIFIILIGSPGISSYYLYKAEGRPEKLEASVKHSARKIFIIYGLYTFLGIGLLLLAGLPAFDSVLLSFSSVSTGGFAPHSDSIAAYGSGWVELVLVFLMIIGATSFFIHDRILRGQLRGKMLVMKERVLEYFNNKETQYFWVILGIFSFLISATLVAPAVPRVSAGIFQAVSALTTTGFTTVSISGEFATMFFIIILMVIGGYAGSTAGGIKLVRLGIIGKSFSWLSKKLSYPSEAVIPFKFGGKVIKEHEVTMISLFFGVYLILLVASSAGLMFLGYTPMDSFFQVASAQGTVGISTVDLAPMAWPGKVLLMVNMLLGRLEIFPFLVLIYGIIYSLRSRKRYEY